MDCWNVVLRSGLKPAEIRDFHLGQLLAETVGLAVLATWLLIVFG